MKTNLGIFPNVWVMVYGIQIYIDSQVRWYDMTVQCGGARRTTGHKGHRTVIPHHLFHERRQVTESVQVPAKIEMDMIILACNRHGIAQWLERWTRNPRVKVIYW